MLFHQISLIQLMFYIATSDTVTPKRYVFICLYFTMTTHGKPRNILFFLNEYKTMGIVSCISIRHYLNKEWSTRFKLVDLELIGYC